MTIILEPPSGQSTPPDHERQSPDRPVQRDTPTPAPGEPGVAIAPSDELGSLRAELDTLRAELEELRQVNARSREVGGVATSRRSLLRLAGAGAVGAVGAVVAGGARPVAAADPNDVVKNAVNPVVGATTLTGSFGFPIDGLFNNATSGDASALYLFTQSGDAPTLRADNNAAGGLGAVALAGNAPGGRDVLARGSGRIAMEHHTFSSIYQYSSGEIHQSDGTLYAMVSPTVRRSLAGPATAGALTVVDPHRVYDSRTPAPLPGRLTGGESRVLSVADARDINTGTVTIADFVPQDATAIMFNLTVVNTSGTGFLAVTPAPTTSINASTINWTGEGNIAANSSIVGLVGGRDIRVHCGGPSSTDFAIDVLGYYR